MYFEKPTVSCEGKEEEKEEDGREEEGEERREMEWLLDFTICC